MLERYCARQGWTFEVITDLGSGMNYRKEGLKRLLDAVIDGEIGRLVITHQDRLLCLSAERVFAIGEAKNVEVVIINQSEDSTFEEDLARARPEQRPVQRQLNAERFERHRPDQRARSEAAAFHRLDQRMRGLDRAVQAAQRFDPLPAARRITVVGQPHQRHAMLPRP